MQLVAIIVSLGFTAVAVPLLTITVRRMLKVMRAGQPAIGRTNDPVARTVNMFKETFLHTRMLQWTWVGILHWFAYAAFLVLSTAVAQAYFQLFDAEFAWPIIGKFFLYEWVAEVLGLLGALAIIPLFIYRVTHLPSKLGRKSRFFGSTMWQAYFVEAMVLVESAAILFIRGAEYNLAKAHGDADHATGFHFPISQLFAKLYPTGEDSIGSLENIIYVIAMIKITTAMLWLFIIARNITMGVAWHRFTAWFNIWFKRESDGSTALGALKPLYINGEPISLEKMEDLEEEDFEKLGVGKVEDFSWKGILDFTTCTECGRCQSQCPAWNTEKPLSPKLLVMGLREHAYAKLPLLDIPEDQRTEEQQKEIDRPLIGDESVYGVIDPDVLWSCTNCGACVQQCPVDIEHVDHIDDMRRFQVLVESNFPAELNNIFKGLERKGNPWGMNPKDRMNWAKDLPFEVKQVGTDVESLDEVEWLFWVGCAGAFEDRAKKTTQAVAELLDTAGVSFAVLGDGETCSGDSARRAGNEIVFQQLAMENVEVFKETKVKKVVSTCAHCFNTLKNEYKEFGIELEVVHHTQLLNRLVREGKLKPVAPAAEAPSKTITYHDPCFVGRHNQVYEAPRELLEVIPNATFTEMPRNKERSFCCGAGGARMWMEENLGSRINVNRTVEAVATGADQIAVGCPFCRVMLSDGLTAQQQAGEAREEVEVLDIAQMLLAAVKRAPETEPTADEDAAVVAEAEAATAAAAGGDDAQGDDAKADEPAAEEPAAKSEAEATEKATEAEPDAEDEADPASISETAEVGEAAEAHEEPEAAVAEAEESTTEDAPAEDTAASDAEVAAEHNVEVDEDGTSEKEWGDDGKPEVEETEDKADGPEPEAKADEPEPEAKADEPESEAKADEPEAKADEPESEAKADEPEAKADEPESEAKADEPEPEPEAKADEPEPEPEAKADEPEAKDTDEESVPAPEPAPAPEGDDSDADGPATAEPDDDEPGPREEEAETVAEPEAKADESEGVTTPDAPAEVVAVEDAPAPDPVSDDEAELTDANPSGSGLTVAAGKAETDAEDASDDAQEPEAKAKDTDEDDAKA